MENASKALLIAAAVLVVILLIAFGMKILNSTGDVSAQVGEQSESTSMQTFNAKFSAYRGTINGTTLRSLIVLINNNNANSTHKITVDVSSYPSILSYDKGTYKCTIMGDIDSLSAVKVTFEYDTAGYINKISLN